jgi:surfactin synthase thioesterase subunit
MGGLLAYEIYYKINEMGFRKAKHIFFSGCKAPSVIRKRENIYTLSDYDFMKKVMKLGGISQELMINKKFLKTFVPIIKNDFKILETYKYKKRSHKIECDVSILNGKQDSINSQDILKWKSHVCKSFKVYNLEGNHFFINNNIKKITSIINDTLI